MIQAGLFYLFETLGEMPPHLFYRQALEETVYGEELGFSATCPAEHHFSEHYGIMPRVELFLAWAASQTQKIKLWPMVVVAPLSHPVRFAEDMALLDNFSEGRLVLSVGSGYRRYEFERLQQEITENAERLREILDCTLRLFSENDMSFQGKFYQFDNITLQPKPFQKPYPPIFLTTTRDDQIEWAAKRGVGVVPAAGFNASTLAHDYQKHAEYAKANGKAPMTTRPFFKWIYLDESHKRAVEEGQNYILKTLMAFAQGGGKLFQLLMGKSLSTWAGDVEKPEWLSDRVDEVIASGATYEDMVKAQWTPYVCGDPKHVTEVLKPFVEAGGNFFIGGFKCGPMPQEKVKHSMRLFAEKVLPNL